MTLKQDLLIAKLPENNYNIGKTARQVGYTEQGSRSGTLYASLREKIAKAYLPETIKAKVVKYEKLFLKAKDHSNLARMIELQAKISKLTNDNNLQQVNVDISGTLDKLKQPKAIDVTT